MKQSTGGKLHWNYFLALERDLETTSRYIEFSAHNFGTYSIELAHLLFAAASEVDVVAKLLCQKIAPQAPCNNINDYKSILVPVIADLPNISVNVARYGLLLNPWSDWASQNNPLWWRSYNNVKHQRDAHFQEATLSNALNSLAALLVLTIHYYSYALAPIGTTHLTLKQTTFHLKPDSTLLLLDDEHYHNTLVL